MSTRAATRRSNSSTMFCEQFRGDTTAHYTVTWTTTSSAVMAPPTWPRKQYKTCRFVLRKDYTKPVPREPPTTTALPQQRNGLDYQILPFLRFKAGTTRTTELVHTVQPDLALEPYSFVAYQC